MMKRKSSIFVIVIIVLIALVAIVPVLSAAVSHFRGKSAHAYFYTYQDCINTSVSITASESWSSSPPGPPLSGRGVFVELIQSDCEGNSSYWQGNINLDDNAFVVENKLASATLKATVPMHDLEGNSKGSIDIDLVWTATGPVRGGTYVYRNNWDRFYQSISRSVGNFRDAQASGFVLMDTKNLISSPDYYAVIYNSSSSLVISGPPNPYPYPNPYP